MLRTLSTAGLAALAFLATPAVAHPKLLGTSPAADASVAPLAKIELHFSEKLVASFSGIDLVMTSMPGMTMRAPMTIPVTASVAAEGMTLVGTTPKPLPKGAYKLVYHVVASDTHRVEGGYSFQVK